jgi:hypothetical protein
MKYPLDRLRAIAQDTKAHYGAFPQRKGDKVRIIRPPKPELMKVQRRLNSRVFRDHEPSDAAHGAVLGRSPKTNAEQHLGQRCVVSMDAKQFYPGIRPTIVFQTLRSLGFGGEVASLITKLVTLRGELPQGAPTSSVVANLVCKSRIDQVMTAASAERDCKFTRFVDDVSMSGDDPRPLISLAARTFSRMGLRVHRAKKNGVPTGKLRIEMRHEAQVVTGLVVNSARSVTLARKQRAAVKAALHSVHALQGTKSSVIETARALRSVNGRIAHVGQYHASAAAKLRGELEALPWVVRRLAESNRRLPKLVRS